MFERLNRMHPIGLRAVSCWADRTARTPSGEQLRAAWRRWHRWGRAALLRACAEDEAFACRRRVGVIECGESPQTPSVNIRCNVTRTGAMQTVAGVSYVARAGALQRRSAAVCPSAHLPRFRGCTRRARTRRRCDRAGSWKRGLRGHGSAPAFGQRVRGLEEGTSYVSDLTRALGNATSSALGVRVKSAAYFPSCSACRRRSYRGVR